MRIGLLLVLVCCIGCSSFNRDWKRAAASLGQTNDLAGRWEGRWLSDANGHNGRLRCLMTKVDGRTYNARFHAKYKKILGFSYTVPLSVNRDRTGYNFTGAADLGKLAGGVYEYRGFASVTNFFSTYTSKYDHGSFRMGRPQ